MDNYAERNDIKAGDRKRYKNRKKKANGGNQGAGKRDENARSNQGNRNSTRDRSKSNYDDNVRDSVPIYEGAEHDNDVAWYKGSSQHVPLVENSAKVANWSIVGGMKLKGVTEPNYTPPALLVMRMVTGPGVSTSTDNSAVTQSAASMYTAIRTKLTNASNYQPADLAMAIMAMDEVYSFAAYIRRAFTILNSYYAGNVQWPITFLKGLYDMNDADIQIFKRDLSNLMSRYNNLCLSALRLTIPANYGFVDRHRFIYSNVFGDGHTIKAQFYGFKPYGYRMWTDTDSQGSALTFNTMGDLVVNNGRMEALIDTLDNMIQNLQGSESFLMIMGDIWKVFGSNSYYAMQPIAEGEICIPQLEAYNILSQIENSINVPINLDSIKAGAYDIKQDVLRSAILFNPQYSTGEPSESDLMQVSLNMTLDGTPIKTAIINAHKAEPTPDDVVEMTRMMATFTARTDESSGKVSFGLGTMGFDFIDSFQIFGADTDDSSKVYMYAYNYVSTNSANGIGSTDRKKLILLSQFDWAPRFYVVKPYTSIGNVVGLPFMDLDNYTYIDSEQLDRLNDNIQRAAWKVGDTLSF